MTICNEALGLLRTAQIAVGQAKDANSSFDQRVALGGRRIASSLVRTIQPFSPASRNQTSSARSWPGFSPYLGHRASRETGRAQALDDALSETAIDEELGGLFLGTRHRRELSGAASLLHDSSGRSGCEPDHVLDLIGRDAEVRRDLRHRIAGLEPVDEILHASAAVDDKRKAERDLGIDDHIGVAVSRQPHRVCPAVAPVANAFRSLPRKPDSAPAVDRSGGHGRAGSGTRAGDGVQRSRLWLPLLPEG